MTIVARFEIDFLQYLDPQGKPVADLPPSTRDPARLIPLYRMMVLTRAFDTKAIALQRTGQLGTYASSLGMEAVSTGVGAAMQADDVLLPTYREYGAMFWRGVAMEDILRYWSGDERGSDYAGARRDFPICVPIATQCCHAVGVAYAMKLRGEARVAVAVCGDGATSKGDFYEGLNAAGLWKLPLVFVVDNNHWAISVPRSRQTGAQTLAQKAIAAGVDGCQVDGNDVIAVHTATDAALAKARAGGGPSLIECLTYRLCDHTTADDASRYRDPEELKAAWSREPVLRLRSYLADLGAWDKAKEEALNQHCASEVATAVERYQATSPMPATDMFDYLYAALPRAYAAQRAEVADAAPGASHG